MTNKSEIIQSIKQQNNPMIVANRLSTFIVHAIREGSINLYEAYLLNGEVIKWYRKGYTQPAWKSPVLVSNCLAILNQKLLSHIFDGNTVTENIYKLGLEAYRLNDDKRKHYIMDKYALFLEAQDSPALLHELQSIRNNADKQSYDDGPYHFDEFPFECFSPETILLEGGGHLFEKTIQDEIEDLIVELNLT
ncbi:hypothetical protein GZH47_11170 [Paenibacillus rhizovicinus]|uniref:DUF4375 domain-containing protein n=1 Tax=Paenibacillus rhizovicinus TaxID=2704463 RepID=A0A6C0NYM9_9BACL|nr:hypothetical protein [Paenibacillus rhizovicinus]QHW31350.1 hypothetical protein GZH47_11170 [Paenibacillus rhizovicinus]